MDNERRKNLNLRRLNDTRLNSELRRKSFLLIEQLENAGLKPLVTQGFRSIEEQNRLYSIGRTKKGKIVTNAKGGQIIFHSNICLYLFKLIFIVLRGNVESV